MKHGTHPSPRQRLFATVASAALALLLCATAHYTSAQNQQQSLTGNSFGFSANSGSCPSVIRFLNQPAETCGDHTGNARLCNPQVPWGGDYGGIDKYFTLNADTGNQVIELEIGLNFNMVYFGNSALQTEATANAPIKVYVDGQLCTSCTVEYMIGAPALPCSGFANAYGRRLRITHDKGYAWATNGVHEWGLRWLFPPGAQWIGQNSDIRFKAVMVGTTYSEIQGYYNSPALPLYILRDPPGDASYSSITDADDACTGTTSSITTGSTQDGFFKARLGVAGTVPFIGLSYEIYGELSVDLAASQSETSANEYQTCMSSSDFYNTPMTGAPDDVFIGSAVRYAYGQRVTVTRPACGTVSLTNEFVSAPVRKLMSYNYTESYIREDVIPDLIDDIAGMAPGAERDSAETQLSVWNQTLAMNDSIKANAPFVINRPIDGGGNGLTHSLTTSTTEAYTINYDAQLSQGLGFEFGVNIGGSGITVGGSAHFQQGYGRGESGSNVATNTVDYHLEDASDGDDFSVDVFRDEVFGTFVFRLDSAESRTSCPYEGGFQIDQPSLSVGSLGSNHMVLNEVTVGSGAAFPLYVCNNSDVDATYYLKFRTNSNTEGGVLNAFGNQMNSNDFGLDLDIPAGECLDVTNLVLTQPITPLGPDYFIELYLYSFCEPSISSSITIEAHFGAGNFGNYCEPSSASGPALGDYVDGVVLNDISNTGTGSVTGASYTDYSAQFSTPLSRNAQQVVSITAGTGLGDHFAVWIDYDQDRTFEASEKLGEFENSAAGETQDIAFTVPVSAQLGSTTMRVRGVHLAIGEPAPVDPCYSYQAGETEDYTVVINANTPQDCAGVNNGTALPGTACNDGNASTGNDTWTSNCQCVGQTLDCVGIPGGTTTIGSPCDDGDTNTAGDAYNANCLCAGLTYDCVGVPGGTAVQGTGCDDGDAATGNDVYSGSCLCAGELIDCLGVIGGTTTVGTPCDDGNPLSGGDAYTANCECVGAFANDCAGVAGGTAQPGTACDDNNIATGNDTYSANCTCAGEAYDCAGTPGGTQLPGTPCDDGNSESTNDVFTADCGCLGELADDCAGVPGGTAQPGTTCDDGDADTGNDVYNAFCECAGQLIDCEGTPGGSALPGFPCDDGDATTGNDELSVNCQCAGQLLDCLNVPGGTDVVGVACDDADANTSDDVYTANCICAGTLALDCEGVAGGTAQPGTTCDDGDANTGNDVYGANCACAGEVIDCEGTAGGTVLPGTPCDDGDDCTTNDLRGTDCACSGTTITIGAVTGASTVIGNSSSAFVITPIANATSYTWDLPNGWTTSDNGAFVLLAEANNTAGPVQVCVTAMVGDCELTSCITVTVDFNTGIATNEANDGEWFTVQPNPSNGIFQLRPSTTSAMPLRISIRNGLGQEVLAPFSVAGQRSIDMDLSDVAAGAYYLLATRNGEQQVIKIMVQR